MKAMGKMSKTLGIVSAIVLFIFGVTMLVRPGLITLMGVNLAVLLIGVSGIIQIVQYFGDEKGQRNGWLLACGILIAIISQIMLFQPGFMKMMSFSFVFAFGAFMNGFNQFSLNSAAIKASGKGSGWLIFGGIMSLLLGFFFCIYPLMTEVIAPYIYVIYTIVVAFWLFSYSIGKQAEE